MLKEKVKKARVGSTNRVCKLSYQKNLTKEATAQAVGIRETRSGAEMIASKQLKMANLICRFVEKVVQIAILVLLPIRKLQKNCKSNLELRLINVISQYKLPFGRLV